MENKYRDAVTEAQKGDRKAFEILCNAYMKRVYFAALKLVKNTHDAEEITQDVLITVFNKIGELKAPEAFQKWLNTITVNKCMDFLRKNSTFNLNDGHEERTDIEFLEETDLDIIPDKSLETAANAKIITEIIDALPLPQRICVYCYYYEQMGLAEIAASLNISEGTVKSRLFLAREKIRKALEELEKSEGIKLYTFPALLLLLNLVAEDMRVSAHIIPQVLNGITVTTATATARTAATATAAKTAAATATTGKAAVSFKLIAAVAVVAVVGGGIVAGVYLLKPDDAEIPALEEITAGAAEQNIDEERTVPPPANEENPLSEEEISEDGLIQFGGYAWRVLAEEDGKMLLLSDIIIEERAYHETSGEITWEHSDIRHYLNGDFYNSFSASDQARIVETNVINNDNPWTFARMMMGYAVNTNGGNDTTDRIFLLSIEEVVLYFGDSGKLEEGVDEEARGSWSYDLWGIQDQYSHDRIARNAEGTATRWRLRSPAGVGAGYNAAVVRNNGDIDIYCSGYDTTQDTGGIRPAMWVRIQ